MEIRVNGSVRDTDATTLLTLLESLMIGVAEKGVAVAVNQDVVPRAKWVEWDLHEGDVVEIIRAAQGG